MLVVIIGPDGCGKTTTMNAVLKTLQKKNCMCCSFEMNFEILPKLRNLINPFLKNKILPGHVEGEYFGGMKESPVSSIRGMMYVAWYALDYFLGKNIIRKYKKKDGYVFFSRYYYDYFFQRRYVNIPSWYIRFWGLIVPKPNFIFTINRSPEDIFNLKPELSVLEIKRQQDIIRDMFKDKKNAYILDGSCGVDLTLKQIIKIITKDEI